MKERKNGCCLFRKPQEKIIYHLEGVVKKEPPTSRLESGIIFSSFSPSGPVVHLIGEVKPWDLVPLKMDLLEIDSILVTSPDRENYLEQTHKMLNAIWDGAFSKLVSARNQTLKGEFDPILWFIKLCDAFPGAFVYLFNSDETGCWMGASPELLLEQDNGKVRSVALAGTRVPERGKTFGMKEVQEQRWVADYIEACFKKQSLESFIRWPEEELNTGHLAHISTRFEAILKQPEEIWNLLNALHPTPAIAGLPKNEAIAFIENVENNPREFYTGYIGWVSENSSLYYVNIRCLKMYRNAAVFFAGAGITKDSDPEQEYQETVDKIDNLISCLFGKSESQL